MLALGCDRLAATDEPMLEYAESFFKDMKKYLIDFGRKRIREEFPMLNASTMREKDIVEESLKEIFKDDKKDFPKGKWSTFIHLAFSQMNILFGNDMEGIIEKLQSDLAQAGSYNMINLKTLRNNIMGQKISASIVFGWGLNDERLCTDT